MARWSEDAVSEIKKYPGGTEIPVTLNSTAAQNKIYQEKYKAASMLWYPLAVNMGDKDTIPSNVVKKYKYVDGSPVFHDNVIYGANVMRDVIKAMQSREEKAAAQFGGMEKWRKDGQRADQNNQFIMDSVKEVHDSKSKLFKWF